MSSMTGLPRFPGFRETSVAISNPQQNPANISILQNVPHPTRTPLPSNGSATSPSSTGITMARRTSSKVMPVLSLGICFLYMLRLNMPIALVVMTDADYVNFDTTGEFAWDQLTQGLILSAFFWGYVPAQSITGLAIHRGIFASGKRDCFLVSGSTLACGIVALLEPIATFYGDWFVLCIFRALMGICQGVALPFTYRILVRVLPKTEDRDVGSLVYIEAMFAAAATPYICSILIPTSFGWPLVFYFSGFVVVSWSLVELFSLHGEHLTEFTPFQNSTGSPSLRQSAQIPWRSILCCSGFWAIVAASVANTWCFWLLITQIPLYFKFILGYKLVTNASTVGLAYLVGVCVVLVAAFLSQSFRKSDSRDNSWISVDLIQKIFNSISFWTPALALIGLGAMPDGDKLLCLFLLLIAIASNTLSILGYRKHSSYLSRKFSDTITGTANVIANFVAISAPIVAAVIVSDPTNHFRWGILFYVTSTVYVLGNMIFAVFGSEVKPEWDNYAEFPTSRCQTVSTICHTPNAP